MRCTNRPLAGALRAVVLVLATELAVAVSLCPAQSPGNVLPAGSGLAAGGPAAGGPADADRQVLQLIEQLGDASYQGRRSARWELERLGLSAFDQLRQAAEAHPNPQIALAARYLIDSQNVVWWLETDSREVRDLLASYNDAGLTDRDTLLQQLSERGTADALLALGRLARFESNEQLSKSAAVYLMQTVADQLARQALEGTQPRQSPTHLLPSLELTLADSQRTPAVWLRRLMADMRVLGYGMAEPAADGSRGGGGAGEAVADAGQRRLPEEHIAQWQELMAREHATVASEMPEGREMAVLQLERYRSTAVTQRLYRWLGSWLTQHASRRQALDAVRASVELTGNQPHALQKTAEWALEAQLPELVIELAQKQAEAFNIAPELGYFQAEAYLRLNDESRAEEAARRASAAVLELLNNNHRIVGNISEDDVQASLHHRLAATLAQRGMHRWAEQEFLQALKLDSRLDPRIRRELAQFYWFGGKHQQAADVLRPVAEGAQASRDLELPAALGEDFNADSVLASYYFYLGLADLDRGDDAAASEHLQRSLQVEPLFPNPDVVIAMRQLAGDEKYAQQYREHLEMMSSDFRIRVLQAEEQLSRAVDRMSRAMAGPNLASECNQLAWLLSKCEVHAEEALNLSLRSLELVPDEPAYLDTLARCYYAAGELENAVRVQKRAVHLAPHERQMAAQLEEFEAALARQ